MMQFEFAWVFLLFFLFLLCERFCPLRAVLLFFPHLDRVQSHRRFDWLKWLKWLMISSLLFAAAVPYRILYLEKVPNEETVVVLDASVPKNSDNEASIRHWIAHQEKVGVWLSGTTPWLVAPLSEDSQTVAAMAVEAWRTVQQAAPTALYDTLAKALRCLENGSAQVRRIVIIASAAHTHGKVPIEVLSTLLVQAGIKLHVIALGDLTDAAVWRKLAQKSGGSFIWLDVPYMLKKALHTIRGAENMAKRQEVASKRYFFHYPLYVAAMSLLLYLFFMHRSEV